MGNCSVSLQLRTGSIIRRREKRMRGVETRIQEIRHRIFREVARMAYHTEWPVDKRIEELPYKIIPGEVGNFRNDVFLERAIVGERLKTKYKPTSEIETSEMMYFWREQSLESVFVWQWVFRQEVQQSMHRFLTTLRQLTVRRLITPRH